MSLKKVVAIAAAAGALAAISVPAMALENEFHGFYQIKGFLSNYNNGAAGDQSPTVLGDKARANNYAEQRARIFYTGKASDDLKLVTAFELDTRFGGATDGKYYGSSDAGVRDGDGINLETKWVYLDFNATSNINVKTGLMPYKDSIKGLFIDADMPFVMTKTKLGDATVGLGYSRFNEADQANNTTNFGAGHLGKNASDLLVLDTSFAVNKDTKVGFSYYMLANYGPAANTIYSSPTAVGTAATDKNNLQVLHTLALSGEGKVGPLSLSGFAAMQTGNQKNAPSAGKNTTYHGYALNAAAKLAVGPGTAKVAALCVSGDDGSDAHNNAWIGSGVQSYNENGMMLIVRNNATSGTTNTNEFVKRTISNVALATIGYDAKIGAKGYANANLGLAWNLKNAGNPTRTAAGGGRNASNYLGTEIALEGGYKVYDNLTASVQAAYLILGGAYDKTSLKNNGVTAETPENPYTTRLVLTYAF